MKRTNRNHQIIYGRNAILDALDSGKSFERIYVKDTLHGEIEISIRQTCNSRDIPLKKVPQIKLDKLSRHNNHQGVVAVISPIQYQNIDNVIPHIFEKGENPILMVLDNVQDVRNIGAIARSSETLGCNGLILSGRSSGLIGQDAIKASSGAMFRIPVCRELSTVHLIPRLKQHGLTVYATSLKAKEELPNVKLKTPLAVIMGSEHSGLPREAEQASDELLKIPQAGKTDSLNVSVAAGIILYEILNQKSF